MDRRAIPELNPLNHRGGISFYAGSAIHRTNEMPSGREYPGVTRLDYELKLDSYRLEAVKTKGRVTLYSRRGNDLTQRFDYIALLWPLSLTRL